MKLVSKKSIGIATAIVIVAIFGFFYGQIRALDRGLLEAIGSPLDEMPQELLLQLRRGTRVPPDLLPFLLPRTEDGNAATFIFDVESLNNPTQLDALEQLYEKIKEGEDLEPDEEALWAEAVSNPALERFVVAARQNGYESLDMMLASVDDLSEPKLASVPFPGFAVVRQAALALTLRANRHRVRGELDEAAADIGAVLGLGMHLLTSSPTLVGSVVGRDILRPGLFELAHYADARDDIRLAEQVSWLGLWGIRLLDFSSLLTFLPTIPDSALRVAADTSLWPSVRIEALNMLTLGQVMRAKHVWSGADDRLLGEVESLIDDDDPQFATAAQITLGTLQWFNDLGPWGRYRFIRRSVGPVAVLR